MLKSFLPLLLKNQTKAEVFVFSKYFSFQNNHRDGQFEIEIFMILFKRQWCQNAKLRDFFAHLHSTCRETSWCEVITDRIIFFSIEIHTNKVFHSSTDRYYLRSRSSATVNWWGANFIIFSEIIIDFKDVINFLFKFTCCSKDLFNVWFRFLQLINTLHVVFNRFIYSSNCINITHCAT